MAAGRVSRVPDPTIAACTLSASEDISASQDISASEDISADVNNDLVDVRVSRSGNLAAQIRAGHLDERVRKTRGGGLCRLRPPG